MKNSVLIVAHPDDEILWFSSIISEVDKIIYVFRDNNNKDVEQGRKNILKKKILPYSNKIISLDIEEADTLNKADWNMPKLDHYGLKVSSEKYKHNFTNIKLKLEENLKDYENIFTHNPWGEYGHEEHVQVFKAVHQICNQSKSNIWVSGYFSERSYKLMCHLSHMFSKDFKTFQIDNYFCQKVKQLFIYEKAWTWSNNYNWPLNENFYLIKSTDLFLKAPTIPTVFSGLHFLLMFNIPMTYFSILRSKIILILNKIMPEIIFISIVKFYRKLKNKYR